MGRSSPGILTFGQMSPERTCPTGLTLASHKRTGSTSVHDYDAEPGTNRGGDKIIIDSDPTDSAHESGSRNGR